MDTVHGAGMFGLTNRQPSVVETAGRSPAGNARSGLSRTHGARVIDSVPPAITTSASPVSMVREALIAASRLDPHSRLTVEPGTDTGSPASSVAIRATLRLSSPAAFAAPKTTSSMSEGSSAGLRSATARSTVAARSSGRTGDSAPPKRPNGVRTASYTNASAIAHLDHDTSHVAHGFQAPMSGGDPVQAEDRIDHRM